jgi:phosphoribosylformimino-5-aminoimidazole carboxamide ribotide isomerase
VKQIVGGSLSDSGSGLRTNFVSKRPAKWFAELYRKDDLRGGHVIMLGPGNEAAAREALAAWPGGLQVGGGISAENARAWLDAGASHVIITSWVFRQGQLDWERLRELISKIGKGRLVLDLSCRKQDGKYFVVSDRWQKFTDLEVNRQTLETLAEYCDEFLIHAADVEGLCQGIDAELVKDLGEWTPIPTTYAGGAKSIDDLKLVSQLGQGRVHLTIGSALDIFGGSEIRYEEAVAFNRELINSQSR